MLGGLERLGCNMFAPATLRPGTADLNDPRIIVKLGNTEDLDMTKFGHRNPSNPGGATNG